MILNDGNNGAAEMRQLTGSYYASNDFNQIREDVLMAEEEVKQIVSKEVFAKAESLYHQGVTTEDERLFLHHTQRCVALLAAVYFFRKNDVSHEDSGRKVKVSSDNTDKIPWQWQLDRDDQMHMEAYYLAVERLIRFLNEKQLPEWMSSSQSRAVQGLLIHSGADFDTYFPIDRSERMFILLLGILREVQLSMIAPAYGKGFEAIVADRSIPETDVHFAACKAAALFTMSVALRRLPLALIPVGVVRSYAALNGSNNSTPASVDEIRTVSDWLEADGQKWLGLMKDYRDGPSDHPLPVIPFNDKRNKFFRT